MKKILCLLLVVILLFLSVGCNSQEQPSENVKEPEHTIKSKETETKSYDNTPYSQVNRGWQDVGYNKFETLLTQVNDIVKATYLGTVKKSPDYFHDFEVKEIIRGSCEKELITVFAQPMEYGFGWYTGKLPVTSYDTVDINYEEGKDYLLLLRRSQLAYCDDDILDSVDDSIVLPLNETGVVEAAKCKMYNTDLALHLRDDETKQALTDGTFIDRVLTLTKDNPTVAYNAISTETDPVAILNEAEYVLVIKVGKKLNDDMSPYYVGEYYFENLDVLKGNYEDSTVELPTEKVETGKTYLIALNEHGNLSGRNSIYPYPVE